MKKFIGSFLYMNSCLLKEPCNVDGWDHYSYKYANGSLYFSCKILQFPSLDTLSIHLLIHCYILQPLTNILRHILQNFQGNFRFLCVFVCYFMQYTERTSPDNYQQLNFKFLWVFIIIVKSHFIAEVSAY
jgi:hypothetical protein